MPYTRIVEYKHKPNQPKEVYSKPGTCIFKEYSVDMGDPYYPVPNPQNQVMEGAGRKGGCLGGRHSRLSLS